MQHTIGIEQKPTSGGEPEIVVRTLHEPWNRQPQSKRHKAKTSGYAPSPAQLTLLVAGMVGAAVAIVYAVRRNRERFIEDTTNVDRRWDRPDRLADTRHEDRGRGRGDGLEGSQGFGSPGLGPEGVGYGA